MIADEVADAVVDLVVANAASFTGVLGIHDPTGTPALKVENARAGTEAFWRGNTGALAVYPVSSTPARVTDGYARTQVEIAMAFDLMEPRNVRNVKAAAMDAVVNILGDSGNALIAALMAGGDVKSGSVTISDAREDAGRGPANVALVVTLLVDVWHAVPAGV